MPSKIDDTLVSWEEAGFGARNRDRWRIISTRIWWTIWRKRNDRCFGIRSSHVQEIKLKCILLFRFWCTKVYSSETELILDVLGSF
ncbi:hypothetical protein MTR67_028850 [Solanum verrucosum]|uniref:Uncharacterized protein n=1 Tax=Solanum verrucosum TaxID=315347 RepID=A0AAF0R6W8_SOLVR|nr:hypothetical protein MTR67_028850 [Solanum verrucosum]